MRVPARCRRCAAGLAVGRGRSERSAAGFAVREGDAQRPSGRADGPGRAAGRARAAHDAQGQLWLHDPAPGSTSSRRPSMSTSTTRRACRASRSTRTSCRTSWVYVYYSPPLNTPVDDPVTPGQRGRRAVLRHPGRLRALQGRDPALALQVAGRPARHELRAADHRRPRRPRHLLPRRRRHRVRQRRAT